MGFMDKAKELAAKAEQQFASLDGPNPQRDAQPLFTRLGALAFAREQGRAEPDGDAAWSEIVEQLRALEAQAGMPLQSTATAAAAAAPPPPPGAAAGAPPPPPGAAAAPPPPAAAAPPPPGAVAPPPPPGAVPPPPPPGAVSGG